MIKLVIWDLDNTFWHGTFAENTVSIIQENIDIVKALNQRGIVNSIVSKNNYSDVKNYLELIGIWELFIFPSISYEPKGKVVSEVIKKFQLRPENTLFLDDNFSNRNEVQFYNKDIVVHSEKFIPKMLGYDGLLGQYDSSLTRFNQYKTLELKYTDKVNYSDNSNFLAQSNIKLIIRNFKIQDLDRVHNLILRTNQLNYTKNRISKEEVMDLIDQESIICKVVHASDKYGEYGIIGFYAYDNKQVSHFLFSCRILNLGIEQFIYSHIGFPEFQINGDIVTKLSATEVPSWISIVNERIDDNKTELNKKVVFFKGGCDMTGMLHYLSSKSNVEVIDETNYVAKNNISIHNDHSISLLNSLLLTQSQKNNLIETIPFIDDNFFETDIFEFKYDVLIYSVLMDYFQEVYKSKSEDIKIIFGGGGKSLTNQSLWDDLIDLYNQRGIFVLDEIFLKFFKKNYDHLGKISLNEFNSNLSILRKTIPKDIPIIFLNGSEVEIKSKNELELEELARFKLMNKELDKFIEENSNCYLVDVRKQITSESEILDNLRHYTPAAYFKISIELSKVIQQIYSIDLYVPLIAKVKLILKNHRFFSHFYNFLGRIKANYFL